MAKNVEAGRLSFTLDLAEAMAGAEVVFIAVGTPTRRGDGHADLTYVMAAAEEVARIAKDYIVVVTDHRACRNQPQAGSGGCCGQSRFGF